MKIFIKQGDILNFSGGAIVNTSNSHLAPGFGLDGQIRKKAGQSIAAQLKSYGKCNPGNVVVTSGGRLQNDFIIHAVGPIWKGGFSKEEEILRQTYTSILQKAEDLGIKTIAIPNISTGIFRFPKDKAAKVVSEVIENFSFKETKEVHFYCFDKKDFNIYQKIYSIS